MLLIGRLAKHPSYSRLTTRQHVESISLLLPLIALNYNGMTRIVSSSTACTYVGFYCEDIDELAFALVTPLRAKAARVRSMG